MWYGDIALWTGPPPVPCVTNTTWVNVTTITTQEVLVNVLGQTTSACGSYGACWVTVTQITTVDSAANTTTTTSSTSTPSPLAGVLR